MIPPERKSSKRRDITPIAIEDALASGGPNSPKLPPPAERIGASPTSTTSSATLSHASPTKHIPSHTRSMSSADVLRQGKRLSLQFPVQTSAGISPGSPRPPSWMTSPTLPSPEARQSPTEGNFLTVLAAQERRVLELKDELRKAEEELQKLKSQWATHEKNNKRSDARGVKQLQPLKSSLGGFSVDDDVDGSSAWMQKEMERRKALLSGTRQSNRKVFSGSRHTRALSLLSPDGGTSVPQSSRQQRRSEETAAPRGLPLPPSINRSSTAPDMMAHLASLSEEDQRNAMAGLDREALLRTGKQMASDLRDGLMTFFEDLRQATVGDEAINGEQSKLPPGAPLKRASSTNSVRSRPSQSNISSPNISKKRAPDAQLSDSSTLIDVGGSFWRNHSPEDSKRTITPKSSRPELVKTKKPHRQPTEPLLADVEEAWDSWDTPEAKKPSPTPESGSDKSVPNDDHASPQSARSSPRTSTSSTGLNTTVLTPAPSERESIPWPALHKLTPTNLRRTASHLMSEWEKSLSPPAEERPAMDFTSGTSGSSSPTPRKKAD